jgi:hypothetical protein
MHPLNALLEVSLYFLKFIEYKKPSDFGGSETLITSLNMIQAARIIILAFVVLGNRIYD